MTDPLRDQLKHDPARRNNPFDTLSGYSGQEYHRDREAELAAREPAGGQPGPQAIAGENAMQDMPIENGRRAFSDAATGAVHGSGSGAGGGNPGEDFDSDPDAGDGYPITGAKDAGAKSA